MNPSGPSAPKPSSKGSSKAPDSNKVAKSPGEGMISSVAKTATDLLTKGAKGGVVSSIALSVGMAIAPKILEGLGKKKREGEGEEPTSAAKNAPPPPGPEAKAGAGGGKNNDPAAVLANALAKVLSAIQKNAPSPSSLPSMSSNPLEKPITKAAEKAFKAVTEKALKGDQKADKSAKTETKKTQANKQQKTPKPKPN